MVVERKESFLEGCECLHCVNLSNTGANEEDAVVLENEETVNCVIKVNFRISRR